MITKPLAKIKATTEAEFSAYFDDGRARQWGVYNRRYIAGTTIWSQHAWGNAWDIGVPSLADGDRIVHWLGHQRDSGLLPVGLILWRVRDHFDHIHVEGKPKKTGTPPKDTERNDLQMELVENIQQALNAAGATDKNGEPLKVDGIWGPLTESAFVDGLKLGGVASGVVVEGTFKGTIK